MTTLHDGTMYVLCEDGSVQQVSSNGKHFKTLTTDQSKLFNDCNHYTYIEYNSKQKKKFTLNVSTGILKILYEI